MIQENVVQVSDVTQEPPVLVSPQTFFHSGLMSNPAHFTGLLQVVPLLQNELYYKNLC